MTRIYVDRVDWDAADRSPLDYISEARVRAEIDYEPDTPNRPNPQPTGPLIDALREVQAKHARRTT